MKSVSHCTAGFALIACLLLSTASAVQAQLPYVIHWNRAAQGLELGRIESTSASFFGTALLAFRIDPLHFRVAVLASEDFGAKRSDARAICKASRATMCVNASFFDESGNALGLVVTRGIQRRPVHQGGRVLSGIFEMTREGARIVHRSEFNPASVLEAVQAGPRLIADGNAIAVSDPSSSRRAGLCIDKQKKIIFYITAANSLRGISIPDLQKLLAHADLDCRDALNLDGGSSAQLYFGGSLPGAAPSGDEIHIEGGVKVPVFLALFLR